jgi:hypothetical protein
MLTDSRNIDIKQRSHRFLCGPDVFVFVVHLNALFFGLSLKYQELSRTIPYFSTFCHILNIVCKNNDFIPYIVILSAFYRF